MRISDWSSDVCSSDLKKSTSQIRQILGKIQSATSSAVMVVEEGTKRVNETIETVNRTGDTIGSLGDAIAENASAAAQIYAATNQKVTGITQIKTAMNDVTVATGQNAQNGRASGREGGVRYGKIWWVEGTMKK